MPIRVLGLAGSRNRRQRGIPAEGTLWPLLFRSLSSLFTSLDRPCSVIFKVTCGRQAPGNCCAIHPKRDLVEKDRSPTVHTDNMDCQSRTVMPPTFHLDNCCHGDVSQGRTQHATRSHQGRHLSLSRSNSDTAKCVIGINPDPSPSSLYLVHPYPRSTRSPHRKVKVNNAQQQA
jgi:hypothetical protein